MKKIGKKKIYWDACIFLAWLQDERVDPNVMDGIEETVRGFHDNKIILMTSIVTESEVFRSRMSPIARKKFEDIFKRRNMKQIEHDQRVARKSGFIRDYYSQRDMRVTVADSLHLASAIVYDADEMHTTDDKLLRFNGNVAGDPLTICKPSSSSKQGSLFRGTQPLVKDEEQTSE